ncbi:MAG: hypothetical protein AAFP68_12285, partial [Pseudomonadota bacterium]
MSGTTYTSEKLHRIAQGWPEFRAFVQETDALAGREIIDNAFRHMFSGERVRLLHEGPKLCPGLAR